MEVTILVDRDQLKSIARYAVEALDEYDGVKAFTLEVSDCWNEKPAAPIQPARENLPVEVR